MYIHMHTYLNKAFTSTWIHDTSQGSGGEEGDGEREGEWEERGRGVRGEPVTADSHLSPETRLRLYDSQGWRMEVETLLFLPYTSML